MHTVVLLRSAVCLLGRFPALAGADLTVERGEIVLLRGPNGAGKTTLLRCAGFGTRNAGPGRCTGPRPQVRSAFSVRRVGLVGHATSLYDDLTVTENVRFWSRTVGASPEEIDAALTVSDW